ADSGIVFFANLDDSRIYRQLPGGRPQPITAEAPHRFADLVADAARGRLIAVREDHAALAQDRASPLTDGRVAEPENTLVAIDVEGGSQTVLVSGHDFYSTPRPSRDGSRLAWLAWRHPNMPWDGTELWVADVDASGLPVNAELVVGGRDESVAQPEWAPDGSLVFVSDRSGWWNLYRRSRDGRITPLLPMEAEFAGPQWVFGMNWYAVAEDGSVYAIGRREGHDELWLIPADGRQPERVDVPDQQIQSVCVADDRVVYLGASATEPKAVVLLARNGSERRVLRRAADVEIDRGYISVPEPITFPTAGGREAHALFYRPTNRDAEGLPEERPPLVVMSHGGPTSSAGGGLDLETQVFTSRGFAVVDVDYGGSTGYGRAYMRRLDGQWGIVDVEDCINASHFLVERGHVDPARLAIRGGSAGGFTTLAALVFHDVFAAGASHYGVGDLEALARDTHKFESRYLDRLVAPYPSGVALYRERSPIHFTDRLNVPIIVLQGADDHVVPVAQAEELVAALREKHVPHAYLLFEGEGHGFRRAENMIRAREAELSFYAQVFGFELADPVEPVRVEFLDRAG
ncbi:MAG TPA: S9 family peptidase, partial [Candidatus Caenarcaniphilales bacterium]|nr:S9 family peptidase [Candidatus Caenarcaniphilales bacterium]